MDPTSGLFAGEGHIPLSATPHPTTAAAITGSTGIAQTTLEYSNVVRRIQEDPRVTLPYTPAQWAAVQTVGALVDKRLEAGDVRMTMGGEPTFVSIDDGTSAEWTIDADGPKKRERAGVLAERLRKIYAPGGVVHRGQGKWYPGEPLPRWAIAMHWRADGVPLWSDPALLADPWAAEEAAESTEATESSDTEQPGPELAGAFIGAVAEYFELPASQVRPAYEDALGKLAQQVRMPAGEPVVDDIDQDSPDARIALLHELDASVTEASAYVLPLHRLAAPVADDDRRDTDTRPGIRPPRRRPRRSAGAAPTGGCVAAGSCC